MVTLDINNSWTSIHPNFKVAGLSTYIVILHFNCRRNMRTKLVVVVMLILLMGAVPTCNSRFEAMGKLKDRIVAEFRLEDDVWNRVKGPAPRPVPPTHSLSRPVNER